MKKFEYKSMNFTDCLIDNEIHNKELNILGQEGRECVSVYLILESGTATGLGYLFKRELNN